MSASVYTGGFFLGRNFSALFSGRRAVRDTGFARRARPF